MITTSTQRSDIKMLKEVLFILVRALIVHGDTVQLTWEKYSIPSKNWVVKSTSFG